MTIERPRRSCLYMPGSNERALEKARSLDADVLILDLEDAVAPSQKTMARKQVAERVSAKVYAGREVIVRINALSSEWGREDVAAIAAAGPNGLLLPKVNHDQDIKSLEALLDRENVATSISQDALQIWAMVETPQAIMNLHEIAALAPSTSLSTLVMGTNDLAKELSIPLRPGREALSHSLQTCVIAAKAYGLNCIDGVYNNFRDEQGLLAECEQGSYYGFDGKTLIHPAQLDVANRLFSPSSDQIEWAQQLVDAFARSENANEAVVEINGNMVERLHLQQAERVLAIQAVIAERG